MGFFWNKKKKITLRSTATWWNKKDIYTSFCFCISQTIGMELTGWKSIMTDYGKYGHAWNSNRTFSKCYNPSEYLATDKRDCDVQRKGDFQAIYSQEIIKIYTFCDSTD